MRTRNWTAMLMSLLVLVMVGCGGGGGSGQPAGTLVSGTAMKGPVAGGTVKVFEVVSSATLNPRANIPRYGTTPLVEGTTGSDGSYSVAIPGSTASGSVMVQITGGSYLDEATGVNKNVATEFGATGLRAVFGYTQGTPVSAAVTPFTEMAVADMGPNPTNATVSASNAKIALAFGLSDIIATLPPDPTKAFPAGASPAAQQYALALAALSQYQKDTGGATPPTMAALGAALLAEINTPANGGGLSPATETLIDASANNFAGSGNNPNPVLNTPTVNPVAPAAIQTTLSTQGTAPVSTSVTVTVALVTTDGTPVPDGTVVTFSTNLGTLSAASAVTANGQASVTLTSSSAGVASVTASAGSASSVTGVSFVNPSDPPPVSADPANITLSASSSPGFTTGPAVVVSANVLRASGTAVPDGTPVSFSIVSGSGTLSAASATTTGGVAAVSLSSTVAGASVGVRAAAGAAIAQISVPFDAPPPTNDPAGITLSTSAPSGFTTGPAVVVTANVVRSSGAAVPDGTAVSFTVVSGSGTLSAATAVTTGGVATVSLNSQAAGGSVGVRAAAGTVSATVGVPFTAPSQVVVKVRTSGTLPAGTLIGGINATVTYPTGKGLGILSSGVAASGAGAGTTLISNPNNPGQVVLGLITTDGIGLGEFATLTFSIANGAFPLLSDFGIAAGGTVINTTAGDLPGVAAGIQSVTVQ